MKESDARKLWCPFSLVRDAGTPAGVNRMSSRDEETRCLGTGCACWLGTAGDGRCGMTQKS